MPDIELLKPILGLLVSGFWVYLTLLSGGLTFWVRLKALFVLPPGKNSLNLRYPWLTFICDVLVWVLLLTGFDVMLVVLVGTIGRMYDALYMLSTADEEVFKFVMETPLWKKEDT